MVQESTADPTPPIRVGVVDDHRLVLDGISAHLDAQDGLSVVVREPTWVGLLCHDEFPVDVAVIDLDLRDQITIGTKLRALAAAGVRSIVMSRHADAASIHAVMVRGAHGFVPKSESGEELVVAIRGAANDTRYDFRASITTELSAGELIGPPLGNRERRALVLYAAGHPMKEVAAAMGTTEDTVKSYIKRGRRKYRNVGIDIGTRSLLRRRAIVEGWLSPE